MKSVIFVCHHAARLQLKMQLIYGYEMWELVLWDHFSDADA